MMLNRVLGLILLGLTSLPMAFAGNGSPSPASQSSTAVTVQSPLDGSTSGPAVQVQASASVPGAAISAMVVNVDSQNVYSIAGSSVNTSITMAAGSHQIYVKAWDNQGRYYDKVLHITVANGTSGNSYRSNHVFVLMLENRSDAQALAYMPYLSGLARQYGMGTQMYAATHGSWLAYGELTAGIAPAGGEALNHLCNGYGCSNPINAPNLVRQLAKDGKSWKGYFQSLPATGWMGDTYGNYARKHNPFPFFTDVANSSSEQKNMVDDRQLGTDLNVGDIANYNLIVPDLAHDGHNPSTTSTALSNADNYLAGLLPQLLGSSYFQPGGDGVLIVTFDESDLYNDNTCGMNPETNKCGGHIFLAMIGPKVKKSFQSATQHRQRDLLKTSCDLLGLSACPGDGAQGLGMSEFFTSSTSGGGSGSCAAPSSPGVHVCAPVASQTYGTPVQISGAGTGASGAVSRMELWIDGRKINNYFSNQINASVTLNAGNHAATLVEVDSKGAYIKSNPVSFTSR